MRIAAIYDIHGNLPALEAVLEDIDSANVDLIVVGGDVLPGPMPRETIDLLATVEIPMAFIHGNGDRAVPDALAGVEPTSVPEQARPLVHWVAEQLEAEDQELIASWPLTITMEIEDLGRVMFCHATPQSDTPIFTRRTPDEKLLPLFENLEVSTVICGHTHMQYDRRVGDVRVVNAGSVGMPFGDAGACWALLESDVELRRTKYDLNAAAERIRATAYPQAEQFASQNVITRPSESQILDVYSKVELR